MKGAGLALELLHQVRSQSIDFLGCVHTCLSYASFLTYLVYFSN